MMGGRHDGCRAAGAPKVDRFDCKLDETSPGALNNFRFQAPFHLMNSIDWHEQKEAPGRHLFASNGLPGWLDGPRELILN